MLGAVGSVAGQSTAVGGDKIIDEVQQLPYTWQGVQEYRECASEGGTHHRVYCLGASVAAAVRCYRPRGRLALFESEPCRGGNATLLEGHRRHATVAIERLEKAHRPRAELPHTDRPRRTTHSATPQPGRPSRPGGRAGRW